MIVFFFFQAEDGIRYLVRSRGLGDVYKRQLLEVAITTDLPLILGAQFNREAPGVAGAAGPGKGRPSLEYLKGSGDLEQDANVVLSVYNEAREKVGTGAGTDQELEICALKNRDGGVNAITKLMLYAKPVSYTHLTLPTSDLG